MSDRPSRRIFTLADAQRLLPDVRARTEDAMVRAQRLSSALSQLPASDPRREAVLADIDEVVAAWAREMNTLDLEVKGLWLVDFDNGDGYYCWKYPEASVEHYHGYDDGFAGRMKIV